LAVHSMRAIRPLIVELEAGRSQVMADAGALDAGGEVVADLALVVDGELVPKEAGDLLGLDHVHRGAHDGLIQGLEGGLLAEHDVGGVLDLHEAPMHAAAEVAEHRAEALRPVIEAAMQGARLQAVGEALGGGGVGANKWTGTIWNRHHRAGVVGAGGGGVRGAVSVAGTATAG